MPLPPAVVTAPSPEGEVIVRLPPVGPSLEALRDTSKPPPTGVTVHDTCTVDPSIVEPSRAVFGLGPVAVPMSRKLARLPKPHTAEPLRAPTPTVAATKASDTGPPELPGPLLLPELTPLEVPPLLAPPGPASSPLDAVFPEHATNKRSIGR
jgi:hypothetical protein